MAVSPVLAQAILAGGRVPDIVGSVLQGQQEARAEELRQAQSQFAQEQFGAGTLGKIAAQDPSAAAQLANAFNIPIGEESRLKSFAQDIRIANSLFKGGDPNKAVDFIMQRRNKLNSLGIETPRINEFIDQISAQGANALSQLEVFEQGFVKGGILQPIAVTEDETGKEIRKEVRGNLRKEVGDLAKAASTIVTNKNKVDNLAKQVAKGNRSAVAPLLVSLVKLGDPSSVVSRAEAETVLNAQNPAAAFAQLAQSKDIQGAGVIQSVLQKIDPLNPETIDVNDLLSTADSLVAANVPTVQDRLRNAEELASENLTEAGVRSIFSQGLRKDIDALTALLPQQQPAPQEAPQAAAPAQAPVGGTTIGRFQVRVK